MAYDKFKLFLRCIPLLIGVISLLLGLVVIIGWYSHQIVLIQIFPQFVPMQYNTALGFVLSGLALIFIYLNRPKMAALSGIITVIIGALTGFQYLSGIDLNIDQLFIDHYIITETSHPGRMAPYTALSFLFSGIGILVVVTGKDFQQRTWVVGVLGSMVLGFGLIAIFGYAFSLPSAYGWANMTRMAMHTAIGLSILGVGMISMAKKIILTDRDTENQLSNWGQISGVVFTFLFTFLLSNALDVNDTNLINVETVRTLRLASDVVLAFGIIMGVLLGIVLWFNRTLTLRAIEAGTLAKRLNAQEVALIQSEQNLAITLNSICDAVITTDAKGRVTGMNPVAEELTGWSIQEADGQPLKMIFPIIDASTRKPIKNPVEKLLVNGKTLYLSNHTTLIAKDGSEYQIAGNAAPIRDRDDHILGIVLVFNDVTEVHHLRERAIAVQQKLKGLFDDMQTMVAITEADGTVNFVNNTPLAASGIELNDVLGKKFWDCIWFNYNPEVQASVQNDCASAQSGQNILRDIQIATTNGLLWISYSIHPVHNAEGQVIQLLQEGRDISERKKVEDEIRESEQHLKLYREQTPLAAIEWNTEFQIIDWNRAAEDMFGYSLDEVKGRDFVDIMLPESAVVNMKQLWKDLMSQAGGTKSINENLTKDGRIILCEWHNTALRDEAGTVIGAASLVLDITAQHKAQQALLVKEHEQREILDSMLDAVITIDETGKIVSFNKTAEGLFGYSSDEIIGKNINQLMSEPDHNKHGGYIQRYLKTEEVHVLGIGREVEGMHKNKQPFPMRLSIAELPADEMGERRFISTCQDLTQIKQQEELLRRTQKMDALGKLTGGISHDFNNMLGVILGYSDLLKSKLTDQPKLAVYAKQIHYAAERGAKLTKKLLSFSRKLSPEAAILDINTLLQEQQDMLQKILTVRIKLLIDLADDVWPIWLDKSDLEDAVLNMSINAMYAMSDKKSDARLSIRTSNKSLNTRDALMVGLKAGDYVQLSITDTGGGMDETTKEKIFDPFFSTKGEKGTGLGLSQVFGFVKRAGGIIKVYSEPGHGSKFALYFPRYIEGDIENTSETIEDEIDLTGEENILIVDDEAALRDLASELLRGQGYHTFCAENGKQALKILEHEHIDLMLSDVIMPEMDGYRLAALVREKYPAIKVQLASGFTDGRHMDIIDESLHQNLLYKPYKSQVLFNNIRALLDNEANLTFKKTE